MSKVLIVGGAGYVGGAVTDKLINSHEIIVYDDLLYEDTFLKDVKFVRGNILDFNKLQKLLDWAETVIWLAAYVGDPACAVNPGLTMEVNVNSIKYLSKNFDGKIIFPSTCSVYGAQDGILTEESPVNPLSVYASSKLQAEEILMSRGNSLIFRLGTLYGISDRFARLRVDLVVNVLTIRAKIEGRMQVFGGKQFRPLLHVKDVANALEFHIDSDATGIFNLHSENLTIREIAEMISFQVPNALVEYSEISFQDSRNYQVSSEKSQQVLNFYPQYSVNKGIEELVELIDSGRVTNFANPRFTNVEIIRLRGKVNDIQR